MRALSRGAAVALTALLAGPAVAQTTLDGQPIVVPSQSSVFNQNSINLPSPPMVSGQDMVRGADGTTCQSAVASGGPYVDFGLLQSADVYERSSAAVYGRVVVPLGRRAKRVDCSRLYKLEMERLRMEVELLRVGIAPGSSSLLAPMEEAVVPAPAEEPPLEAIGAVVPPGRGASAAQPTESRGGDIGLATIIEPLPTEVPPPAESEADVATSFAQVGAFADLARAEARLMEASFRSGGTAGIVRPLARDSGTLFRVLLGPLTSLEAAEVCQTMSDACIVIAGL